MLCEETTEERAKEVLQDLGHQLIEEIAEGMEINDYRDIRSIAMYIIERCDEKLLSGIIQFKR